MSDLNGELLSFQRSVDSTVSWRDQVIALHEKGLQALESKLSTISVELIDIKVNVHESAEKLENLPKLVEQRDRQHVHVEWKAEGAVFAELGKMKEEFLHELSGIRKLIEHTVSRQALNKDDENRGSVDADIEIEIAVTEKNQTAEAVADKDKDLAALTGQTINEQDFESKELQPALGKSENGEIAQIHKQRSSSEMIISENNKLRLEFDHLRASVEAKDEEVNNLKVLLKQAELKLEERQEQLMNIVQQYQCLAQQITDEKRDSMQVENIRTTVESINKVISSWPEMLKQSTRVTAEELTAPGETT